VVSYTLFIYEEIFTLAQAYLSIGASVDWHSEIDIFGGSNMVRNYVKYVTNTNGSVVVKALCCKPEGCGFETQ
jgi:hypothetical protein